MQKLVGVQSLEYSVKSFISKLRIICILLKQHVRLRSEFSAQVCYNNKMAALVLSNHEVQQIY
jgi:hypothetical protein